MSEFKSPRDVFLTRDQIADRYQVSKRTPADWATNGGGPPYILAGGSARYRLDHVYQWEEQRRQA